MGFYCNGFSTKLVKIAQEVDLATWLTSGATREGHMRSTCQKLKSQCVFRDSSHDLANLQDDLRNALTVEILSVTLISFTHIIHTLITQKLEKRLFRRQP